MTNLMETPAPDVIGEALRELADEPLADRVVYDRSVFADALDQARARGMTVPAHIRVTRELAGTLVRIRVVEQRPSDFGGYSTGGYVLHGPEHWDDTAYKHKDALYAQPGALVTEPVPQERIDQYLARALRWLRWSETHRVHWERALQIWPAPHDCTFWTPETAPRAWEYQGVRKRDGALLVSCTYCLHWQHVAVPADMPPAPGEPETV